MSHFYKFIPLFQYICDVTKLKKHFMVKELKDYGTVFYFKQITGELVKQRLRKTLNKNLKSVEEVVLLEALMKEPHENETPN